MPWRHQFCMVASAGLPGLVVIVEGAGRDVAIELRTVGSERYLEVVEDFLRKAIRIGRCLHHQGRHRADQRRLRHPALAVARQIVRDLAAAGGMADVNGVLQIEMRRDRREIVGIVIHVVAVGHLAGAAVAAAVMRDDAIAVIEEEQHLRIPIVGRQRPAVAEHDGLAPTPVLVKDLDAVLGCDRAHGCSFQRRSVPSSRLARYWKGYIVTPAPART